MGDTSIEWTDKTWNPIRGCSRVSEGCRNCYAEKVAYRFSDVGQAYHGLVGIGGKWNGQVKFIEEHLLDPLKWKKPQRIFVNSMSDLFHENVTDEWLDEIFAVMALCPQHTFQVLTKRPERMLEYLSEPGKRSDILEVACGLAFDLGSLTKYRGIKKPSNATEVLYDCGPNGDEAGCGVHTSWPLLNVQLGVSVENQKAADERIPLLLYTPAAVRFISAEPLLGEVSLTLTVDVGAPGLPNGALLDSIGEFVYNEEVRRLDWVIAGGESGPGARPMHPDWARSLRDQCVAAGVPFFFKQWGEWGPCDIPDSLGDLASRKVINSRNASAIYNFGTGDDPTYVYRVGKKASGALLDGREWREFPAVTHG